ncbi:astacin (Peptidase family m12A) domain-containing protein [Ditylenchus destructor]|nr:astacin (Peptidase family m12A) domain-containing protein [Ditylenchus destructor]
MGQLLLAQQFWMSQLLIEVILICCVNIVGGSKDHVHFPKVDTHKQALHIFHKSMKPHMKEMKKVKKQLDKIRDEMLARKRDDRRQPTALLAHAMELQRCRLEEDAFERRSEGIEGVGMINQPIHDYMYQGDMLLDSHQTKQMMKDLMRTKEEDDVRPKFPPKLHFTAMEHNSKITPPSHAVEHKIKSHAKKRRTKRQAQTGRNFPRNQWDPNIAIPYYFDGGLNSEARRVIRMAIQFWTDNTCLSFVENGASFPRVRFFAGGGCFSQVGKAFHSTEQMISIGRGCEQVERTSPFQRLI